MKNEIILIINSGSSSIKYSTYHCQSSLEVIHQGEIEVTGDPALALEKLLNNLEHSIESFSLKAVGHRVVHGGRDFFTPVKVTETVFKQLSKLIPLAPYHQKDNLLAIEIIAKRYPLMLQVACFDTAFHHTQPRLATLFALPRKLTDEGIMRYGFHGLSYEYIASVLPQHIGSVADKKVIVAHLGGGASMCAMSAGKSMATSMGLTALDGLIMGKRCGSIDPGVLLYLLEEKKKTVTEVSDILYKQSGLLGVSNISDDVRVLQTSTDPHAKEALDLFCYRAAQELGALAFVLKGCDAIIFTAGIGENSAWIREKICNYAAWLGLSLDSDANKNNAGIISPPESKILVGVIPTNEALMIARHTYNLQMIEK